MRAVAAASSRSAARMSGRRCSSAAGESTAIVVKCGAISRERELGGERAGPLAEQHGEPVRRDRLGGDERRNRRFGGGEPRRRARDVELAAAAELEPHARELQRLLLIARVRARDAQALLRAAQLDVVARDLGRDEHLRVAQVRDGGIGLGTRGFDAAAHAAEEIELPQRREACVVALDLDALRR